MQWLSSNLDNAAVVPAAQGDIDEAMTRTSQAWPDELRAFFASINGFAHEAWVPLLPAHELFDVDRVVEERQMELDVWSELDAEMGAEPNGESAARDTASTWLAEFVPFAGRDGNLLFVDTRPGPLHGCVTEFDKEGADEAGPQWVSLSALLTDLADTLETGRPFADAWTPTVVDGQLNWAYVSD